MAEQTVFITAFKKLLSDQQFKGDGFKYKDVLMSNKDFKQELENEYNSLKQSLKSELEDERLKMKSDLEDERIKMKSELEDERLKMKSDLEAERLKMKSDLDAQLQAELQKMRTAHEAALKENLIAMTQAKLQQSDSVSTQVLIETHKHLLNKALENNKALSVEIDQLKTTVASQKTTIDTLNQNNNVASDLTKQIEDLNKQISDLKGEITRLTTENDALIRENNKSKTELSKLQAQIDNLTADNTRLATDNTRLATENANLTQDINTLRADLQTLTTQYNDCETRNKDCLSEIVKHKLTIQLLENNSHYKELYVKQFLKSVVLQKHIDKLSADHIDTLHDLNTKNIDSEKILSDRIKDMLSKIVEQSVQIQLYESQAQAQAQAPAPAPIPCQETHFKDLYTKCFVELAALRNHMNSLSSSSTANNVKQNVFNAINEALFEKHKTAINKQLLEQKLYYEIQTSVLKDYYNNRESTVSAASTDNKYPNINALLLHK